MAQIERRFKAHRGAGLLFLGRATVSARGVAIIGGKAAPSFSQATEVRSRPCGSASLPVQAKCCLPGLLRRELLGPRAHQCCGPRVAGVALERIALEEARPPQTRIASWVTVTTMRCTVTCAARARWTASSGGSTSASEIAR